MTRKYGRATHESEARPTCWPLGKGAMNTKRKLSAMIDGVRSGDALTRVTRPARARRRPPHAPTARRVRLVAWNGAATPKAARPQPRGTAIQSTHTLLLLDHDSTVQLQSYSTVNGSTVWGLICLGFYFIRVYFVCVARVHVRL